jgi:hypothetical protein
LDFGGGNLSRLSFDNVDSLSLCNRGWVNDADVAFNEEIKITAKS